MQEKSLIKKRILQYLEFKDITKYQYYKKTGTTRGILDQNNGITEENIYRFLDYAKDISLNWLLYGRGDMIKGLSSEFDTICVNENISRYNTKTDKNKLIEKVPLYNMEAIAGVVAIFESLHKQEPIAYIEIPNLPKCDGAVYVVGDSMYPLLKSGDIIIYKELNDISNIFWGEMYLLSMVIDGDSFVTVKYVQKSDMEGFVRLVSQNQNHQDKDIPLDSIKFAALIKASIRINCM